MRDIGIGTVAILDIAEPRVRVDETMLSQVSLASRDPQPFTRLAGELLRQEEPTGRATALIEGRGGTPAHRWGPGPPLLGSTSGREHRPKTPVFLVLEHAVAGGAILQREAVGGECGGG